MTDSISDKILYVLEIVQSIWNRNVGLVCIHILSTTKHLAIYFDCQNYILYLWAL